MAGSQLKRLKASLREQGITGPQKSKKQKRQFAQDEKAKTDKRLQRGAALGQIREQFNPFDLKHNPRGPKFDITTNRPQTGAAARGVNGRPTEAKSLGEQRVRLHCSSSVAVYDANDFDSVERHCSSRCKSATKSAVFLIVDSVKTTPP